MAAASISGDLRALVRGGHAEECLRRAAAELARAEAQDDLPAMARMMGTISLAHQYAGRPRESLLSLYRAIATLESLPRPSQDDRATSAWLHSLAAADLATLGDLSESLRMINQAQSYLCDDARDPTAAVRILNNLAVAHHRFGDNEAAIETITQAVRGAEQVDDDYLSLHSRANGVIYRFIAARELAQTDPVAGHDLATSTLATAAELEAEALARGWSHVVAMMYREAGPVLVETGNSERARELMRRCRDLAESVGRQREVAALTVRSATVERLAGAVARAAVLIEGLDDDVADESDPGLAMEYHAERTEVLAALGRHEDALISFRHFHRLQVGRLADHADAKTQALGARVRAEHAQSLNDPLTGVGNRRYLERQLDDLQSRSALLPLSVLFVDLDHFKTVNDVYGHLIGDRVLIQIASLLAQNCRANDRVCRFGGEEFVLLLPECGTIEARELAEHLCRLVEHYDWQSVHHGLQVTCSVGVATGLGSLADEVMLRADAELYRAKLDGRNRVSARTSAPLPPRQRTLHKRR